MPHVSRIFFALFEGFEPLDLSGPASVFQAANNQAHKALYETIPITPEGGMVKSSAGFAFESYPSGDFRFSRKDFMLVVGGEREPLFIAGDRPGFVDWLYDTASQCGHIGSVCSGAYLLARTGLANGHTISSHWDACGFLSEHFREIKVDAKSIYTRDNNIWTSAGVTTGIDMALAIVENDHGAVLSSEVAKRLVVFARRQGNQTQFSSFLEAQARSASREIHAIVDWMIENCSEDISVSALASKAGMSERTFYRKFESAMGVSPAKFMEQLRLDLAKSLLEGGVQTKEAAYRVGFRTYSGFRAAFLKTFGLSPSAHQRLHAKNPGEINSGDK